MKTILFDMYGVIIKESKGNFIPYTFGYFPKEKHESLITLFRDEQLFTKAGNGELSSHDFLRRLGFPDPDFHMRDYIENHLTIDNDFFAFAESHKNQYHYALLSNDVSEWSRYITAHHSLDGYLTTKIVSADVGCRKPEPRIYEIALERLGVSAGECIFIDNSTANLRVAETLGMRTILFNRDGEAYDGRVVYSFGELTEMLSQPLETQAKKRRLP